MDITIDTTQIDRWGAHLREQIRAMPRAEAALLNNMAFGVRTEALRYIPTIMVVRNPRFLSASLRVNKASTGRLVATLASVGRNRFTALWEQEFGGEMQRHPASKIARGGNEKGQIKQSARLRGDIITPDDVELANIRSERQRMHAYLEVLQRRSERRPFIVRGDSGFRPGLMQFGKLIMGRRKRVSGRAVGAQRDSNRHGYLLMRPTATKTTRQVNTLQQFDAKGKTRVRSLKWMKPSIARYLAGADMRVEYQRAIDHVMRRAEQASGQRRGM